MLLLPACAYPVDPADPPADAPIRGWCAEVIDIDATTDVSPPSAPRLTWVFPVGDAVGLTWEIAEEFGAAKDVGYRVLRDGSTIGIVDGEWVGPQLREAWLEAPGARPSQAHRYEVRAIDENGRESVLSNSLEVVTFNPWDPRPASAPRGLRFEERGCGLMRVTAEDQAPASIWQEFTVHLDGRRYSDGDRVPGIPGRTYRFTVSGRTSSSPLPSPPSDAVDVRFPDCPRQDSIALAVVPLRFADTDDALAEPSVLEQWFFSGEDSTAARMARISGGQQAIVGQVLPRMALPLPLAGYCAALIANLGPCDPSLRDEVLARLPADFDRSRDNHLVFAIPGLPIGGLSGDPTLVAETPRASVDLLHEVGHNLGLHHANGWECGEARVGVSTRDPFWGCDVAEYEDPYDLMGGLGGTDLSVSNRLMLGTLTAENLVEATQSGVFELRPLDGSSRQDLGLLIPLPDGAFYVIETLAGPTRGAQPPESPTVIIRLWWDAGQTLFIDALRPECRTEFADTRRGLRIVLESVDEGGAVVRVDRTR